MTNQELTDRKTILMAEADRLLKKDFREYSPGENQRLNEILPAIEGLKIRITGQDPVITGGDPGIKRQSHPGRKKRKTNNLQLTLTF